MNILEPLKKCFPKNRHAIYLVDGNVISIEQTKKILKNPELSDNEAEKIRDGCRMLAEVIFDKWLVERKDTLPSNKT